MSDIETNQNEQLSANDQAREERIAFFGIDILDPSNWKTFKSNKIVKSTPMTREHYNRYRNFPQVDGENPNDAGYLIEYTDGGEPNHPHHKNYISWSPKDVFDRNHEVLTKGEPIRILSTCKKVECFKPEIQEIAARLPMSFNGELLLELLKEALPEGIKDKLYLAQGDHCYSIGLTGENNAVFIKDVEEDTIRYHLPDDKEPVTHVKTHETMDDLFVTFFEILYPKGANPIKLRGHTPSSYILDEAPFFANPDDFALLSYMEDLGNGIAKGTVEILSGKNGELSFGDALKAVERGYRVCRSGWNGKGMWITVSNPCTADVKAENFWNQHNANHARSLGGTAKVPPCFTMCDAAGQIQMGWLPSQPDCFAKDWYIIDLDNNEATTDGESQATVK